MIPGLGMIAQALLPHLTTNVFMIKLILNNDDVDCNENLHVKTCSDSFDSHYNNNSKDENPFGNTTKGNKV